MASASAAGAGGGAGSASPGGWDPRRGTGSGGRHEGHHEGLLGLGRMLVARRRRRLLRRRLRPRRRARRLRGCRAGSRSRVEGRGDRAGCDQYSERGRGVLVERKLPARMAFARSMARSPGPCSRHSRLLLHGPAVSAGSRGHIHRRANVDGGRLRSGLGTCPFGAWMRGRLVRRRRLCRRYKALWKSYSSEPCDGLLLSGHVQAFDERRSRGLCRSTCRRTCPPPRSRSRQCPT